MGMDIYGRSPNSDVGCVFYLDTNSWCELWSFCCHVDPGPTTAIQGYYNEGDGLGSVESKLLAQLLRRAVESGDAKRYAEELGAQFPPEGQVFQCELCNGPEMVFKPLRRGVRVCFVGAAVDVPNSVESSSKNTPDDHRVRLPWCSKCGGSGWFLKNVEQGVSLVRNALEFADFLDESGGFRIW